MRQSESTESTYSVRAVQRVMDIFDVLQQSRDGVTLAAVAEAADLPKSSAFRYLATLESRHYVHRDEETGTYRLGMAFLSTLGRQLEMLAARAAPVMRELRDRFEETINLGVFEGDRVSYLEIVESPKSMRLAARKGDRHPIHSTALGKAIASTLPEEPVRAILAGEGMPQLTPRTITDVAGYFAELEEVRRRGYALDDRENEEDGRCVAVVIPGSEPPAAISLSAPASRLTMDEVQVVASALEDAARRISHHGDLGDG